MAFWDFLTRSPGTFGSAKADSTPPPGTYASANEKATAMWHQIVKQFNAGDRSESVLATKAVLEKAIPKSVGIPDLGFKGARQQLFQRFNLIDLYGIAHNNSTVKTAITGLKQE